MGEIRAAAERLKGRVERTPCRLSRTLSRITGADVWVKFENLQFTAAYKERGALNKLLLMSEGERRRGVIAASAGNHAQALAFHAANLGVPAVIVMPRNTPTVKVEHTRDFGAEVILTGETYDEAAAYADELCRDRQLVFVHPFNDPDVIAGQGTVALEMLEDAPDLDTLVVPIGGGGLMAGMATAARALNPNIALYGVEPAMYPSFSARMQGLPATTGGQTIAEGIAVKAVGDLSYAVLRPLIDEVLLVEEPQLEQAVALYANVEKTVVEGAGAAALAALLTYPEKFRGKTVGVVISGGNIDSRLLASVLTRELVREQRIVSLRIVGDDRPGLLAKVSNIIGAAGANIIEVAHNRLALDVPAKGAEFDVMIETRDAAHTQDVIEALRAAGYPPRSR
ncbi:MAG: threonine ammonia-lyase [Pseudomonadota bacterium]|nr:threonine ammonia-lyase [Pseudomonadota bacterium]